MEKYKNQLIENELGYLVPCLMQMDNQYYSAWEVEKIVGFWIEIGGSNGQLKR